MHKSCITKLGNFNKKRKAPDNAGAKKFTEYIDKLKKAVYNKNTKELPIRLLPQKWLKR